MCSHEIYKGIEKIVDYFFFIKLCAVISVSASCDSVVNFLKDVNTVIYNFQTVMKTILVWGWKINSVSPEGYCSSHNYR